MELILNRAYLPGDPPLAFQRLRSHIQGHYFMLLNFLAYFPLGVLS
jgi:hypothetical protein